MEKWRVGYVQAGLLQPFGRVEEEVVERAERRRGDCSALLLKEIRREASVERCFGEGKVQCRSEHLDVREQGEAVSRICSHFGPFAMRMYDDVLFGQALQLFVLLSDDDVLPITLAPSPATPVLVPAFAASGPSNARAPGQTSSFT